MLEKFKKNVLSSEQMKNINGGVEYWTCTCNNSYGVWSGWGSNTTFGDQIKEAGCANTPTYCTFSNEP